jgi:murein L,D-transpeptidase YafK
MISRLPLHRNLLTSLLAGCLVFMLLLPATGRSWAQDLEISASRAIPEALVYADYENSDQPGIAFAVIVDKSRQQVFLYKQDGYWRMVAKWPCSTGKLAGPKEMEGDQRTPEGVYFAIRDVGPRFLTETYGSRAMPLDYPNWLDKRFSRSGSAIWLHGTNKNLQARDSNGCIVLENATIERLALFIGLNRTPVIIVDRLRLWAIKDARQAADVILTAADQWHEALMHGSYSDFRQFYADSAAPSMQWWQKWCRLRHKGTLKADDNSFMERRAIYKWGDGYVLLFDHVLAASSSNRWVGRRKLYLSMSGNEVRIFGDTYQPVPPGRQDPLFQAWRLFRAVEKRDSQVAANEKKGPKNFSME